MADDPHASPGPGPLGRPTGPSPLRRAVRELGLTLITLGVIILLFVVYQLFGTNLTEARNQAALKKAFNQGLHGLHVPPPLPSGTPSAAPSTAPGDAATVGGIPDVSAPGAGAIDHMVIPKIGLDKFVVDGTAEADLSRGPGHYANTPYPGQLGNVGIAGHRTTYGAPFYRLDRMTVGDDIFLTDTAGHRFRYQVDQSPLVVPPNDVGVLDPTTDAELTLTTCNPPLSATTRLVIKAKLVGLPAPARAIVPVTAVPASTAPHPAPARPNLTGGNGSAWPPTLLYGAAVVVLWAGTRLAINRTRRWARLAAYLVGIGVCLAPLWGTFENVVRLLPQSI